MSRLIPPIQGLPRAYWYLWAGMLVNKAGAFVVPFLALFLTGARHLSVEQAGAIVSLWGAGALLAGPVGGLLADRYGRRATMVLALSAGAAAMLHLGLARSPTHVAVATLALGFFGEMYRPAMHAAMVDLVPPVDRARAYAFVYWAINFGFSIAPLIAGVMVSRSYTALFVGDALTTLAFACLVLARVPETRPAAASAHETLRWLQPYTDGVFVVFALLTLGIALVFQQFHVAMPIDMRAHGISPARYGALIATNGILIVLVQPSATVLVQRLHRSRVMAAGALLAGAGFGLFAVATSTTGYLAGIAVWTLGEIAVVPVGAVLVAEMAPSDLRGSYQGAYQMSSGAASLIAPSLGGLVLGRLGARSLWLGCLALGLAVALGHLALAPARRRRMRELRSVEVQKRPAGSSGELSVVSVGDPLQHARGAGES
jgi:MFS family permease